MAAGYRLGRRIECDRVPIVSQSIVRSCIRCSCRSMLVPVVSVALVDHEVMRRRIGFVARWLVCGVFAMDCRERQWNLQVRSADRKGKSERRDGLSARLEACRDRETFPVKVGTGAARPIRRGGLMRGGFLCANGSLLGWRGRIEGRGGGSGKRNDQAFVIAVVPRGLLV